MWDSYFLKQFRPLFSITLSLSHAYVHAHMYTYEEYKNITVTLIVIIYISLNYGWNCLNFQVYLFILFLQWIYVNFNIYCKNIVEEKESS